MGLQSFSEDVAFASLVHQFHFNLPSGVIVSKNLVKHRMKREFGVFKSVSVAFVAMVVVVIVAVIEEMFVSVVIMIAKKIIIMLTVVDGGDLCWEG